MLVGDDVCFFVFKLRSPPRSTLPHTPFPPRRSAALHRHTVDPDLRLAVGGEFTRQAVGGIFVQPPGGDVVVARGAAGAAVIRLVADGDARERLAEILAEAVPRLGQAFEQPIRSEEHTSELQSLMRISYAVFCLKKKKNRDLTDT